MQDIPFEITKLISTLGITGNNRYTKIFIFNTTQIGTDANFQDSM